VTLLGAAAAATRALLRSSAGRIVAASLAVKLTVQLIGFAVGRTPPLLGAIDTLASFAVVGVAGYVAVRGLANVSRRLLWRVRRKLILSYVFIGAVPAALIVVFFLLGGLLLFAYVGSYLMYSEIGQFRDRTLAVAEATALELNSSTAGQVDRLVARRQAELARLSPAASVAVISAPGGCDDGRGAAGAGGDQTILASAGPWAHLERPRALPAWIGCGGSVGLLAYTPALGSPGPDERAAGAPADRGVHLVVRAVVWTERRDPAAAIVVDLPVDRAIEARLLQRTSVELLGTAVTDDRFTLAGLPARAGAAPAAGASAPGREAGSDLAVPSVSFLEYLDWSTGQRATLYASIQVWIRDLYIRISAEQGAIEGRSLGRGFLIALLVVGLLFLLIQCAAIAAGLALARSITGSVHELFAGTARVRQGDFTHRITVAARDQLGELASSFNTMTASIGLLLREAGEKKRLEEELRIAHDIQMSLLPRAPVSIPGLSLTAVCVPAREVGGDYYDFLPLDDDRLGLIIADVAGKGTSAALYMAELRGLVLSLSKTTSSPRELLMTANRLIAAHLSASRFITMTYAVVDMRARTMTYARAGHTPLLFAPGRNPGQARRVQVLAPDGLVLGLNLDDGQMFDRLLEERTVPLSPGDVYVFYTDGITEAMNAADDCFGEERLVRLVEEHADLPSVGLRDRLLRDVELFVGGAPQHDDMTVVLVKIGDWPGEGAPLAPWREDHAAART
jgi:serine phosphatase RsbU (regulator of sigma subunit)